MNRNRTSVMLQEGTLEKLKESKPFDSMSHDEFIRHLLDKYERPEATAKGVDAS